MDLGASEAVSGAVIIGAVVVDAAGLLRVVIDSISVIVGGVRRRGNAILLFDQNWVSEYRKKRSQTSIK